MGWWLLLSFRSAVCKHSFLCTGGLEFFSKEGLFPVRVPQVPLRFPCGGEAFPCGGNAGRMIAVSLVTKGSVSSDCFS